MPIILVEVAAFARQAGLGRLVVLRSADIAEPQLSFCSATDLLTTPGKGSALREAGQSGNKLLKGLFVIYLLYSELSGF